MKRLHIQPDLRIALLFALFGGVWILLSDKLLTLLVRDIPTITIIEIYKGWLFVATSAILIYILLRNELRAREIVKEKLSESQETYYYLFANHPHPMWIYDLHTLAFLDVNQAAIAKYGFSHDEFLQMTIKDIRPPQELPRLMENLNQQRLELEYSEGWQHRLKDGSIIDVSITSHTIQFNGHEAALVVSQDITDRKRSEEELVNSERRFRALIENGADYISLLAADGSLLWESPADIRMLGYAENEFLGQNILEIVHPEDLSWVQERFAKLASTPGAQDRASFRLRKKDGSWRWVETAVTNLLHEPSVKAIVINYHDITDRKQAEDKLHESEERYRTTLNNMMEGCQIIDYDWRYLYVNNTVVQQGRKNRDELLSHTMMEVYPGIENTEMFSALTRCMEKRHPERMENKFVYPDGSFGWFELSIQPVPEGLFILSMDITERKQAEDALRESEDRYRDLVENSQDLICTHDLHGNILSANQAAMRFTGYSQDALLTMNISDLLTPRTRPFFQTYLDEIQANGQAHGIMQIQTASGEIRYWEYDNNLRSEDVQIPFVRGMAHDITERKQAEGKVLRLNRLYATLSQINQTIVRVREPEALLEEICRVTVKYGQFRMAWIGLVDESDRRVKPAHFAGEEQGYLTNISIDYQDTDAGRGPTGTAIREGYCVICQDIATDPRMAPWREQALQRGYSSSAAVPFRQHNEIIGALTVYTAGPQGFDADDEKLLDEIGSDISFALDTIDSEMRRKQAEQQIAEQLQRLKALHTVDRAIASNFDLNVTLGTLLEQLTSQLKIDVASIYLFDKHMLTLEHLISSGLYSSPNRGTRSKITDSVAGKAIIERHAIYISDLSASNAHPENAYRYQNKKFTSYYVLPLISKGQVKGVLEIFQRTLFEITMDRQDFLETLAEQAAIAIDISRLFNDLQKSNMELALAYDATIEGWSRALDLRDHETEGHTLRVTEMTKQLARSMNISEADIVHIRRGALLHDIGKLGVPDRILLKPDKLTDEEMQIMHQHPILAYEMLQPIDYLKPSLHIPYCHHEKWDGTGYPRGLKGEEIPLEARIFAIVDVWDALRSDRPYRVAWPDEQVINYIREQSGRHFDPKIVEIFLSMAAEL